MHDGRAASRRVHCDNPRSCLIGDVPINPTLLQLRQPRVVHHHEHGRSDSDGLADYITDNITVLVANHIADIFADQFANHIADVFSDHCGPDIFTDGYLKGQWGNFELVDRRLSFGSFLYTWRSRLIFKILGAKHWEKFFAWRHPASAIYVTLKVVK